MIPGKVYKTTLLRHETHDLDSLYGVNYFGESAYIISLRLYYQEVPDQKEREVGS